VEPECIVPITGLLDSRHPECGQLVIAGDPKQLGPILRSQFSLNYGLGMVKMLFFYGSNFHEW
jgi:helicase MOV-10